jgi:hypothetical protein
MKTAPMGGAESKKQKILVTMRKNKENHKQTQDLVLENDGPRRGRSPSRAHRSSRTVLTFLPVFGAAGVHGTQFFVCGLCI